ncbi:MAG: hypothetical protein ACXQTI_05295 [Candidatus Nezhaarchaeales archaeon]
MASSQEQKLAKIQEIVNRGLVDQLPPEKQAQISEMINRGLITSPSADPQSDEQSFGAATDETARTIAQNALAEVGSGFAGIFELATGGDAESASDAISDFQRDFSHTPSERSQAQLQNIGAVVENITEGVNRNVISGLGGVTELVTGQGLDQAVKTMDDIGTKGTSQTASDRTFEETGSPAAAAVVSAIPTLIEGGLTLGGAVAARPLQAAAMQAVKEAPKKAVKAAQEGVEVVKEGVEAVKRISIPQSARKQEIGRILSEEADVSMPRDISTVGYDLVNPTEPPMKKAGTSLVITDESGIRYPVDMEGMDNIDDVIDTSASAADEVADIINTDRFKVKNNRFDKSAQKQGFSNGMISFVKGANAATKAKLRKMTDLREKARKSGDIGVTERPSDVVGDAVLERIKFLDNKPVFDKKTGKIINLDELGVKQKAGIQLDLEVDRLPDNVDYSQALINLKRSMEKDGVEFRDGKINWDKSVFSGDARSQNAFKDTLKRFSRPTTFSGKDLHNSKLWLDQTMDIGKIGGDKPLSDRVQRSLLRLRTDVNHTLRDASPGYKRANVAYSDALQAVDEFNKSMGHAIDVQNIDEFTKAGVGTKLRAVFSNQAGRANMQRSLENLDQSVKKYGGEFDDNVLILNSMATELDRRFGSIAPQSFGGQIKASIDTIDRPFAKGVEKLDELAAKKFKSEEKAFQSMKDLLDQ